MKGNAVFVRVFTKATNNNWFTETFSTPLAESTDQVLSPAANPIIIFIAFCFSEKSHARFCTVHN